MFPVGVVVLVRHEIPHHPEPKRAFGGVAGDEPAEEGEFQEVAEVTGVTVLHPRSIPWHAAIVSSNRQSIPYICSLGSASVVVGGGCDGPSHRRRPRSSLRVSAHRFVLVEPLRRVRQNCSTQSPISYFTEVVCQFGQRSDDGW